MKRYKGHILLLGLVVLITSCQKVINIDLNSASPAIVITGNINDQPGPYTVTLSQTVNFSQPNIFPPVSGAFVLIADNTGIIDTLIETMPGIYHTKKTTGATGRTYFLTVIANGQTYTSSSTMPAVVPFDTLEIYTTANNFKSGDTSRSPEVAFQDPAAITNYYRFIETRNDTLLSNVFAIDDNLSDGRFITFPLRNFRGADTSLAIGDSVKVEMQCIDQGTYNYLSTFNEASGGSTNVTPSNPVSNISNNALGYFSAHTSQYKAIKVPDTK